MSPLLPGLLVALFGLWAGTFFFGARAGAAACSVLGLLLAGWVGRGAWADPLRLGSAGRLLPWAVWLTLAASLWASPVPRAGWMPLLLFPLLLLLAAATARCWSGEASARPGLSLVSCVVGVAALWGLVDWLWLGSPRAAMPLGHHNLLATWLVTLLPLAALPILERGWRRWLGASSCGLGVTALAATGSLFGVLAIAVQGLAAGFFWKRARWIVPLVLGLLLVLQTGRIVHIFKGEDPSMQARWVYTEAGWKGALERPLLGWGPGSSSWLLAEHLRPVPGVNPPGEVVGDLHSLPLQVLFELGLTGAILGLGLAGVFVLRRLRMLRRSAAPMLVGAGLLGLTGFFVARLGGGELGVTALPVALAVAAGASLAGCRNEPRPSRSGWGVGVYLLGVAVASAPLLAAQGLYDRAVRTGASDRALDELERAADLDPALPLYAARAAWLRSELGEASGETAGFAHRAALQGVAVAPLWLGAGVLGAGAGEAWATEALERAWSLDPFGALAPFHLLTLHPEDPRAVSWGASALVREPRLLAARFWQGSFEMRAAAVAQVAARSDLEEGWRAGLVQALEALPAPGPDSALLGLTLDRDAAVSLSLHVFRRQPWAGRLAAVAVDLRGAEATVLPPATTLPGHRRESFLADAGRRPGSSTESVEKGVER